MKTSASLLLAASILVVSFCRAEAQLLEGASVYGKAAGMGAGLGAAMGASKKNLKAPLKLDGDDRVQADKNSALLMNQATAAESSGNKKQAIQTYKNLADWRAQVYGEKDKATATMFAKVGDMAVAQKDYKLAENSYRRNLTMMVKSYGPGTPELIPTMTKLATVCAQQGNLKDAEAFISQVSQLSEREYGPNDSRTIEAKDTHYTILGTLADKLLSENRNEEAAAIKKRMADLRPATTPGAAEK
jgi:hypothetical protein